MEFPENIPGSILDEIALEGLEGITISSKKVSKIYCHSDVLIVHTHACFQHAM